MRRTVQLQTSPPSAADDFVGLYDRALDDVYSYIISRVRSRSVAEDLTQDVLLAGAQRLQSGTQVDIPWLIAVARNKVVDHWRAEEREQRRAAQVESNAGLVAEQGPMAIDPGRASEVLQQLNATYRIALVLRHVDGLPVRDVATHLGRTVEATEQVLSRARAAFRRAYEGEN